MIGIYGGKFNPPTIGHEALATEARKHFDELWMLPCVSHPYGTKMIAVEHRIAMCKLLNIDDVKISTYEQENGPFKSTYALITALQRANPKQEFSLVVGMDNANDIKNWIYYKHLIQVVPFAIFSRAGYTPEEDAWFLEPPHQHFVCELPNVSSTEVKEKINTPEANKLIAPEVQKYINQNGLYRK